MARDIDPNVQPNVEETRDRTSNSLNNNFNGSNNDHTRSNFVHFFGSFCRVGIRLISLVDSLTDINLFLISLSYNKMLLFSILLFISIISPYILSYSIGARLFSYKRTFIVNNINNNNDINIFWAVLSYLLPTGVIYFIILDFIDLFIIILNLILLFPFFTLFENNNNINAISKFEDIFSKKFAKMDKMNWEAFKRQKMISQLTFETIPQIIIQLLLLYFNIFSYILNNIDNFVQKYKLYIIISVICGGINAIFELFRLYKESNAVDQTFLQLFLQTGMFLSTIAKIV